MQQPDSTLVVFDTRNSAGQFERELCAFVTGQVGDMFVGEEIAEAARPQLQHLDWYEDNVYPREDEEGVSRVVVIWPTPGRVHYKGHQDFTEDTQAKLPAFVSMETHPAYESVAILVDEPPPAEVLAEMIERAQIFCKKHELTYIGCRVLQPKYQTIEVSRVIGYDPVS